jgi:chondroitin AC lyase
MIPGVTSGSNIPKFKQEWGYVGESSFSGRVSNGFLGIYALGYRDYNVNANKSYFCFNDAIICLGSDLSSQINEELHTTIEQCHLKDNVSYVSENGYISNFK